MFRSPQRALLIIALTGIAPSASSHPGFRLLNATAEPIYRVIGAGTGTGSSQRLAQLMSSGWIRQDPLLIKGEQRMLLVQQEHSVARHLRALGPLEQVVRYHHVLESIANDHAMHIEDWHRGPIYMAQNVGNLATWHWDSNELRTLGSITFAPGLLTFGDLQEGEIRQIQFVVNRAREPLFVVGSAVPAERRNLDRPELPIGKGENKRSDIDYLVSLMRGFERYVLVPPDQRQPLYLSLPSVDRLHLGAPGATYGNAIYFAPGEHRPFLLLRHPHLWRPPIAGSGGIAHFDPLSFL